MYRFNSSGTQTLVIPAVNATPNLVEPEGIAVDGAGNIYVGDIHTSTVYRFNPSGTADAGNVTLDQFNASGTQTLTIPATCATPNLVNPEGIATGSV